VKLVGVDEVVVQVYRQDLAVLKDNCITVGFRTLRSPASGLYTGSVLAGKKIQPLTVKSRLFVPQATTVCRSSVGKPPSGYSRVSSGLASYRNFKLSQQQAAPIGEQAIMASK